MAIAVLHALILTCFFLSLMISIRQTYAQLYEDLEIERFDVDLQKTGEANQHRFKISIPVRVRGTALTHTVETRGTLEAAIVGDEYSVDLSSKTWPVYTTTFFPILDKTPQKRVFVHPVSFNMANKLAVRIYQKEVVDSYPTEDRMKYNIHFLNSRRAAFNVYPLDEKSKTFLIAGEEIEEKEFRIPSLYLPPLEGSLKDLPLTFSFGGISSIHFDIEKAQFRCKSIKNEYVYKGMQGDQSNISITIEDSVNKINQFSVTGFQSIDAPIISLWKENEKVTVMWKNGLLFSWDDPSQDVFLAKYSVNPIDQAQKRTKREKAGDQAQEGTKRKKARDRSSAATERERARLDKP